MLEYQQFVVTGEPGRAGKAGLRVNIFPATGTIAIRDTSIHIGLDRYEAAALATALTQAIEALDGTAHS